MSNTSPESEIERLNRLCKQLQAQNEEHVAKVVELEKRIEASIAERRISLKALTNKIEYLTARQEGKIP